MDALLQLLVSEIKLVDGLTIHQEVFNWGGVDYPQGPPVYHWGSYVELIPSPIQPYIINWLPVNYKDEAWLGLDVRGNGLDLLEREVNGEQVNWMGRRLDDLLKAILIQQDRWGLIFEPNYDQLDNIYRLSIDDCVNKLKSNLRWTGKREGFIAIPLS